MREQKQEPVPTPWEYSDRDWCNRPSEHSFYIRGHITESDEEGGRPSAVAVAIVPGNPTGREVAEATASFIVRAANSYGPLLAACEAMLEEYEAGRNIQPFEIREMVRAAIAKAKGQ